MSGFGKSTLLAPLTKMVRSLNERGFKGMMLQLYTIGDLRFGTLKGTDKFGNKYYEDLDLPYGQHRYVEYADIHNPDPVCIQPEWHGWMHHMFDETPDQMRLVDTAEAPGQFDIERVDSDAIFTTHLGAADDKLGDMPHTTLSQYRSRGYGVGSLISGPFENKFYKQPGHPLYEKAEGEKVGRFSQLKNWKEWKPENEAK
jgi:hypothetical protein